MKLSQYIATLQAIMGEEGDIDVVKSDPAYGGGSQGFGCRPVDGPRVWRSGTLYGQQSILSQSGRDISSTGNVVCVNSPVTISLAGGGGGGNFEFVSSTGGNGRKAN